ncbi:hypothetical protein [Mongoliibacter ruber]|uniref:DUF4382 domain-containing protein n=1 Tax=Mongoliibacter ruber TaxID=1750599 RepID=A0A2T0WTN1_9BACT|nr:hypothetical protein [Mongoliibacter ruber]PRY89924.1 hypothetical protein CLW00_102400 [Mongoliibacter ruber]
MNRTMKSFGKGFLIVSIAFTGWACTEDQNDTFDEPNSSATLSATVVGENAKSPAANERIIINGLTTTDFHVGIKEVEMRYVAKADILAGIDLGSISLNTSANSSLQTEASGEHTLVLMSSGDVQTETVAQGNTPDGSYREVDFRLFKDTEADTTDFMHERSLWISGQIDGENASIWLDEEMMVTAESDDEDGVMVDGETAMEIVFDLNKLFEGVDFSTAVDSNNDGMIEIGPGSDDENSAIQSQIESNISSAVSFRKK